MGPGSDGPLGAMAGMEPHHMNGSLGNTIHYYTLINNTQVTRLNPYKYTSVHYVTSVEDSRFKVELWSFLTVVQYKHCFLSCFILGSGDLDGMNKVNVANHNKFNQFI